MLIAIAAWPRTATPDDDAEDGDDSDSDSDDDSNGRDDAMSR
jgi:hypothetical protein